MPTHLQNLACVVGEASGDLLAATVLAPLIEQTPPVALSGIGGSALQKIGMTTHHTTDELAVMGLFEVLRHYPRLKRLQNGLIHRYLDQRPDVFLGVDAPDFNLTIETKLRAAGIPTAHLVSPSIWAWRPERIDKIKAAVDLMLLVFPFESAIYQQAQIPSRYVGHPLAEKIPLTINVTSSRAHLANVFNFSLDSVSPWITLMPGSRRSEINHLTTRFLLTALAIWRVYPSAKFIVPCVGVMQQKLFLSIFQQMVRRGHTELEQLPLHTILLADLPHDQRYDAIAVADLVLVASGTATLEVALFKKPMVIAYHFFPPSYWYLGRKQLLPWVGLPNILENETVAPEFIQSHATPKNLIKAALNWLDQDVTQYQARMGELHLRLRRPTAQLVCKALNELADTAQ